MKRVAVITATRAEYGLLSPVIKELRKYEDDDFSVDLIVTGTHLCSEYGMTVDEIDDRIDHRISIPVKSDTEMDISENQADTLVKYTKLFVSERYDAVIVLGDRYEMLAITIAAGNTRTPVFHLCGGDTTEGAMDEWIRHSITKISYLHFVTNEDSRRRVIQLGEDPSRVFNYGSTSIDNIKNLPDMSRKEALENIGLPDGKYALCTYHPVTLADGEIEDKVGELTDSIREFSDIIFIVTKSNADKGGARINELLDDAGKKISNVRIFTSLGEKKYLSLMRHTEFILGNSSSGIIEAPAFHVPTINIGDRQKGRLQAESIINCSEKKEDITEAIKKALSDEHRAVCAKTVDPYGDGHAASRIAARIVDVIKNRDVDLKKRFYNTLK